MTVVPISRKHVSRVSQLAEADTWQMDGTFDSAPTILKQLYVISVPLGNSAVSYVYGVIYGKSQSTYEDFLQAVLDGCSDLGYQPDPTTIVTDFEQECITAVSTTLGSMFTSRAASIT